MYNHLLKKILKYKVVSLRKLKKNDQFLQFCKLCQVVRTSSFNKPCSVVLKYNGYFFIYHYSLQSLILISKSDVGNGFFFQLD